MRIDVCPGTDTRYPSVRVKIDPDNPEKYSSRQIALVFRHGESEAEMREAIDQAVSEYMDRQAVTAPETPAAVLGERDVA